MSRATTMAVLAALGVGGVVAALLWWRRHGGALSPAPPLLTATTHPTGARYYTSNETFDREQGTTYVPLGDGGFTLELEGGMFIVVDDHFFTGFFGTFPFLRRRAPARLAERGGVATALAGDGTRESPFRFPGVR